MATELWQRPAHELAGLIASKAVSPVELTTVVLERIDRLQPRLNAFITVCHDAALGAARQAEQAVMDGAALGPLHGVPFAVKDLVNTAGVRTTFGSLVYEHNVPAEDAVAAARMKAAGGILLGKTTTPEFGHKALTDAPLFGRSCNPWNVARTCGGSSGGASAAVAAGLGPLGIATDGGGSTRIPAACCGLVGLKQTLGTVPHSQVQDAFGNYTYVTPLSRTVLDTALQLSAMAGAHPSDPWSIGLAPQDFVAAARPEGDLKGRRILWSLTLGNTVVARDVRAAFEAALHRFAELGAELVELTEAVPKMEPIWRVINHASWRARFGDMIRDHGARMSPSLLRQVEVGAQWSAVDYQRAMFERTALFRRVQGWLEANDVLVTPTLARTALPIEQDLFEPIEIDGEVVGELRSNLFPYTLPFNITGHPAMTVPCGFGADGLPIGLQLVGRLHDEPTLLRVGALYEAAERWAEAWPDL
ncbi:MAG: glutamyl-tRNA amidotransferase [Betaproteobacteria bacterium SG8_39]|nr:MAG: glutamyl-tRNA amidotransferase [Betaproteobacteria bacterium SG8_39]